MGAVLLIVWAMLAVIGGAIADRKHRNPLAWAVLCFFLGIFGVILIAVVSPLPPKRV